MRFGISTHIYHDRRLDRDHLGQIASYGFDAIELFATQSHFDYRDETAIAQLAQWLKETGLTLHGVHAPITDLFGGKQATAFSTAARGHDRREIAVRETEAALQIARRIPFDVIVLHLGTPTNLSNPDDNHRQSAVRSVEEICQIADPLGVRVAVEVIPNRLSDATSLVALIENEIDGMQPGYLPRFRARAPDG